MAGWNLKFKKLAVFGGSYKVPREKPGDGITKVGGGVLFSIP